MRTLGLVLVPALLATAAGCPSPPSAEDASAWSAPETADGEALETVFIPPTGCFDAAECEQPEDLPSCRLVACVEHVCRVIARPDDAACDDSDPCTVDDRCAAGGCDGAPKCDDDNPCTTDLCMEGGECVNTNNQLACDDGDLCTSDDHCQGGACAGDPVAPTCDDLNPCTDDACDPATGTCVHDDNTDDCDDGSACTLGDRCEGGECAPGPAISCDEDNPCTDSYCDPAVGCVSSALTGPCDDDNVCTEGESCQEGSCVGTLILCDDHNACTDDYCDPETGCVALDNALPCDDGDPCTLADRCGGGSCQPGEPDPLCCETPADCDDGDPCTEEGCVEGYCAIAPLDCDDGSVCTIDGCEDGECTHLPVGALGDGPLYENGFEQPDMLEDWTFVTSDPTGHVTWQPDFAITHTGLLSLYFGEVADHSYDGGATLAVASFEVLLPPGTAELGFFYYLDVADQGCVWDFFELRVAGETAEPLICNSAHQWKHQSWDLSPWAGRIVRVELRFDTVDAVDNDAQGMWIDDLVITADGPEGCCETAGDCPADPERPCAAPACDASGACGFDESGC